MSFCVTYSWNDTGSYLYSGDYLVHTHMCTHTHTCAHARAHMHAHAHTFNHVCIIVFITNICSSECCSFASTTAMNNYSSSSSSSYWREWSVNVSPSETLLRPLHQAQWSLSALGERCILSTPKGYCLYFQEWFITPWCFCSVVDLCNSGSMLLTMIQFWNMDWNSYCI